MKHTQIQREITLLKEWAHKARQIPTEYTGRHCREEWVVDTAMSDYGSGHYQKVDFATITRWALAEFIVMEEHPKSISHIISTYDETPSGGFINFSRILEAVDRKIGILQDELELTGKMRANFYHDSYQFAEPRTEEVFSAADFAKFKASVERQLRSYRHNSTDQTGSWWVCFGKHDPVTGGYDETFQLFRQRIKL